MYTGWLFRLAGYHVANFRIAGLAMIFLSALVFWMGYCRFVFAHCYGLDGIRNFRLLSFLFIALGGLLHYQWSMATPSYYNLTAATATISAGFTMLALGSLKADSAISAYLALICAGMAIGAASFIKFPAGIMLGLITGTLIVLWRPSPFLQRLVLSLSLAFGFVLWALCFFAFVQDIDTTILMFRAGWGLYQSLGAHDPGTKVLAYPIDLLRLTYSAILIFWPSYLMLLVFAIWRSKNQAPFAKRFLDGGAALCAVFAVTALLSVEAGVVVTASDRYQASDGLEMTPFYIAFYLGWIILLVAAYAFVVFGKDRAAEPFGIVKFEYSAPLAFLLAVPFAASVGTANPLYNVISFYAPAWFGVLLFLITTLALCLKTLPNLFSILLLLIGAFTASNTILGGILAPAEMPIAGTSLFDQKVPTKVGFPQHEIKLATEQHQIIEGLRTLAESTGFRAGDDIIAVNYLPGLVFALGGQSPGHPAFLLGGDGYLSYSKIALQFSDVTRRRNALLLIDAHHTEETLRDLLNSGGLDFPARYQKVGVVSGLGNTFTLYKPTDLTAMPAR
jgi:hypothetical protein